MNLKPFSLLPLFIFMPLSWIKAIEIAFDFKDPKNVNNIIFQMDAPLESINGSADGISGKVLFDPKNPASTKGKIVLEAKSLHVGNPVLKEHMLGKDWLHVEKFPMITFNLNQLKNTIEIEQCNNKLDIWNGTLYGDFNKAGLRRHPKIKLRERHPQYMAFNMNY